MVLGQCYSNKEASQLGIMGHLCKINSLGGRGRKIFRMGKVSDTLSQKRESKQIKINKY
jgi:hypothetical protein